MLIETHAQFEAALHIVETLRAERIPGISCRRLRPRSCCSAANLWTMTSRLPLLQTWCSRCFRAPSRLGLTSASCWWPMSTRSTPKSPGASMLVTEVATFRSDGVYSDGRHPDAVRYTTSAEEDVQRRDFTINGLLLDPASPSRYDPGRTFAVREVIDFVGGLADLDAGHPPRHRRPAAAL